MATPGNDTTTDTEARTLHVRYRSSDHNALEETLAAIDRGETPDPHFEVVYHDPEDIHRVTRPNNLELLRAIVQYAPTSIRETARLVDRDVRPVHRNLTELEELHLIELVEDGQSKRPRVWYDAIDIDLPLDDAVPASDAADA
jgi:predicted transcriptional regulator